MREVLSLQYAYIAKKTTGSPSNSTKTSGTLQSDPSNNEKAYAQREFNPFKAQVPQFSQESQPIMDLDFSHMMQLPQPECHPTEALRLTQANLEAHLTSEYAQNALFMQQLQLQQEQQQQRDFQKYIEAQQMQQMAQSQASLLADGLFQFEFEPQL